LWEEKYRGGNVMAVAEKEKVPIKENFWTIPVSSAEEPQLIGSKCCACGEIFFPRREKGFCVHCYKKNILEDIKLSRRGKIVTFSIVMQQPGGGFYKGPVPYVYGLLDLPEGVRIETLFSTHEFSELKEGGEAELVIEKLCEDDEGREVSTFKFRPI
jgi:uncharacterized OB-fold protein